MKYFLIFIFAMNIVSLPVLAKENEPLDVKVNNEIQSDTAESSAQTKYIPATHSNLSQLLWKFNVYNVDDDQKLDNFMLTKNCKLYRDHHEDEFIWQNIRQGLKREIEYYSGDYLTSFEVSSYVRLGRYNFNKLAFDIENSFKLYNEGAIIFPFEDYDDMGCILPYSTDDFPIYMKFLPDNRFALTHVPIAPNDANALLKRINKYVYNNSEGNRNLALRLRIKITSIDDLNKNKENTQYIVFKGYMDEIAIFEDPEMTIPVWVKKLN